MPTCDHSFFGRMVLFGSLLLTLATVLVLTAIFTPWYSVEQTWEVQKMEYDFILEYLDIEKPIEMTGKSLLKNI